MTKLKRLLWRIKINLLHLYGLLTNTYRMAPSFIIIGAQKGGTSSLFHYLKYHPQIKRPIKKEMQFFNSNYSKGANWYLAHFPFKSLTHITGEATPDYIFDEYTPERIKELYPHIKLIALLRNPIERAYSAYHMNRRLGVDPRPTFDEAVTFEINHIDSNSELNLSEKNNFLYLSRGKYAKQLAHWLDYFDRDQLLVIGSNWFYSNTEEALLKIYEFLDIKPLLPPVLKPINVGSYPPLSNKLYAELKAYFHEDLLQLKKDWNIEFNIQ